MVRFKLATFLMSLPVTGRYRGPGYVTRFDGEGRWSSTADGDTQPAIAGRYSVDGDVLSLSASETSVRYQMTPTPNGFRIHLLDDGDTQDIELVRVP